MREPCVIHGPVLLLDPHRLGAHLQHERFSDRPQNLWGGDPEAAVRQPHEIHRGAGEGHGRMQGQTQDVMTCGRLEDPRTVTPGGVHHELSGLPGAGSTQTGHQRGQRVIGDGQQDQLGPFDDFLNGHDGYAGEQVSSPDARLLTHRRDGHKAVAGPVKGGAQDGTDPAGADDPDVKAGGSFRARSLVTHARNASVSPEHVAFGP